MGGWFEQWKEGCSGVRGDGLMDFWLNASERKEVGGLVIDGIVKCG